MPKGEASGYEVGSQPPAAYCAWHSWAGAQHRGGLRQAMCPVCGLWRFPQEKCDHDTPRKKGDRK